MNKQSANDANTYLSMNWATMEQLQNDKTNKKQKQNL